MTRRNTYMSLLCLALMAVTGGASAARLLQQDTVRREAGGQAAGGGRVPLVYSAGRRKPCRVLRCPHARTLACTSPTPRSLPTPPPAQSGAPPPLPSGAFFCPELPVAQAACGANAFAAMQDAWPAADWLETIKAGAVAKVGAAVGPQQGEVRDCKAAVRVVEPGRPRLAAWGHAPQSAQPLPCPWPHPAAVQRRPCLQLAPPHVHPAGGGARHLPEQVVAHRVCAGF